MSKKSDSLAVDENGLTERAKDFSLDTPDPDDFDIDAWIDGATTETQTVRLYRNLGKLGEYQRLEQEFIHLQNQLGGAPDDDTTFADAALGEVTPLAKLQELAPAMKAAYDELQADALWATVRGQSDQELDAIRKKANRSKAEDKAEALTMGLIAAGTTFRTDDGHEFTLLVPRLKRMRQAIGDKQFNKLARAANIANGFDEVEEVVPDFWRGASEFLATPES